MKKFVRRRVLVLNIVIVLIAVSILFYFDFGKLSFLASDILIPGSAVFILWTKDGKLLRKNLKFIAIVFIIRIVLAYLGDATALKLGIWGYGTTKTLNIYPFGYPGPPLETLIFASLVFSAIAAAAIRISAREESFLKD
jgi:hypothetical protein